MRDRTAPLLALLALCVQSGPALSADATAGPADAFLAAIAAHCGKAYRGRMVANEPAAPNDPFAGKELVMHVRECAPTGLRIPFHVGARRRGDQKPSPQAGLCENCELVTRYTVSSD